MIKGFVLITFILLIWQNFSLRKAYLNQREYFIKVLSHDLRVANIAHIRGLELLEKVYSSDLILDIKESCKYSLDMISMLLNIYRFEKGEQILDYEYFNPNLLITECCKNFSDKISEKAIFINIVNDLKKCVYADKKAIYKVFLIL